MLKLLISISSCEYFEVNGLNQPLRDTWLPEAKSLGCDYKFFHGTGSNPAKDIVVLPVDDGMGGLTEKAKAKAKWAYENGYDFVFSCFPDTYLRPERLLVSDFAQYDYYGRLHQHPGSPKYCQGGPGYVLSREACRLIFTEGTSYLNDDCWLGDVMHKAKAKTGDNRRFTYVGPGPLKSNDSITNHLSTQPGGYTIHSVRIEHQRWLDSL